MAPSGSNALLFDVHYDGIFLFVPLRDETISKLRIHENRKKDVGNMSYEELVSWAEEEAQHLKTPPKPRTVSKKVWDSLTPKKNVRIKKKTQSPHVFSCLA
nr:hypothetical protein [Tanacetum cinerariifolium]